MLRAAAAVGLFAVVPLMAGCLSASPFEPCRRDEWPAFSVGESRFTLCQAGDARDVLLYVPSGIREPAPLLLLLHGGGGSAEQVRSSSGMDAVADELGFAVLYAEGTPARNGARLHTWNAMACCGRAFDLQVDDVGFLGDLLEGAVDRWPVDAARVGVAGHSNGAMMAYRLAAERSDLVAAVMPVAGAIGGRIEEGEPLRVIPTPAEPVSVLVLHARDDDHVPYEGGHGDAAVDGPRIDLSVEDAVQFWLDADGCPRVGSTVGSVERGDGTHLSSWDGCARGTVVHVVLTEGGHGWPGSQGGRNPAPEAPDASEEIGLFLLAHPRGAA